MVVDYSLRPKCSPMLLSDKRQTTWTIPMPPITIRFDEDLETWLRSKAAEEDVSVSEVVRRLVAEGRQHEPKKLTPYESWQKHFKDWSEDEPDVDPDLADNTEEALRKIFDEKRRRLG